MQALVDLDVETADRGELDRAVELSERVRAWLDACDVAVVRRSKQLSRAEPGSSSRADARDALSNRGRRDDRDTRAAITRGEVCEQSRSMPGRPCREHPCRLDMVEPPVVGRGDHPCGDSDPDRDAEIDHRCPHRLGAADRPAAIRRAVLRAGLRRDLRHARARLGSRRLGRRGARPRRPGGCHDRCCRPQWCHPTGLGYARQRSRGAGGCRTVARSPIRSPSGRRST